MADVKWIKITTDVFDDEKILLIESLPDAYAIIVVWFKLLCLAGKQNNSGVFLLGKIAYTDKMLATIFRMKESTVTMALQTFEQFGMVEIIDGVITIPNWGKHQSLDQLESKKQYMRNYMQEYREKQKALTCKTNSKTNSKTNVRKADKEEEKEREKEGNTDIENQSIYQDDAIDTIESYTQLIKEQIEYEYLLQDYPCKKDILEEILNLMVETIVIKRKTIRIANADYPYEMVKGKLLKLDMGHIRYVLDCLDKNSSKIKNIKSYLLTTLYNATNTIGNYYQAEVNYDMYGSHKTEEGGE